jgi:V/A-type H+-transporting ATPase subunit E
MNGVDKIIERIKKDAEAKVKKIMDNANNEAENVRKRNEKKTRKIVEKIKQTYENEAETVKNTILSGAKIESKRIQLQIREEVIKECFIRAEKKLANMDGKVYEKFLSRIIKEGVDVVGENAVMKCAEKDIRVVKKIASSLNVSIDKNFLNTTRGVIIKSKDGKIRVDNTFDGILNRNKESFRKEVAKILFGG